MIEYELNGMQIQKDLCMKNIRSDQYQFGNPKFIKEICNETYMKCIRRVWRIAPLLLKYDTEIVPNFVEEIITVGLIS